jgi:hypothetical protein
LFQPLNLVNFTLFCSSTLPSLVLTSSKKNSTKKPLNSPPKPWLLMVKMSRLCSEEPLLTNSFLRRWKDSTVLTSRALLSFTQRLKKTLSRSIYSIKPMNLPWKNSSKPSRIFTESPKPKDTKSILAPNRQTNNPQKKRYRRKYPSPTLTKATTKKRVSTCKKSWSSTRSMRSRTWFRKRFVMGI